MKNLYAITLLIISGLANSATITVDTNTIAANDGQCDLHDAITSANTDSAVDSCEAGSGSDSIVLATNTSISNPLPNITTPINMSRTQEISQ